MSFVNIKLHTEYSLLEGVGSIEEYINKAKKNNQKILGITDTNMFASMYFYNECIANDIKPIIGFEVYIPGVNADGFHALTVYARNLEGLKEISKLSTISYEKRKLNFLNVDIEDIKSCKNIYVLSGGVKGEVIQYILNNDYYNAKKTLEFLKETFENFFFEVPLFDITKEQREYIYTLYSESGVSPIYTNDVYYVDPDDKILQKVFSAIKENRSINSVNNDIKLNGLYFKSENEMLNLYPKDLEEKGINNLKILCEDIDLLLGEDKVEFPRVDIPNNMSDREYIEYLINNKINEKYEKNIEKAKERVKYELDIIDKMGYIKYFLIVHDFINYAKKNDIYVGPGRGSAAGSIISYLLDITEVDPLKYDLIFERFLNPQRISMPDIDVDIEQERRMDLIEYIKHKYSPRNVSQIITFSTFKPALAIKDVARVLEIPEKNIRGLINKSSKLGFDNLGEFQEKYSYLINIAKRIENKVKNMSTHAAGVIITKKDMRENLPLVYDDYTKDYQIQYEANILEKLGYLKMDILGLKNLNIVKSTVKKLGLDIDVYNLPYEKEAFDLMNKGNVLGIFQSESTGMRSLAMQLKVNSIDDIALLLALYRPGPLESGYIPNLIEVKNKGKKIEYLHPILEKVLSPTYGMLVYQEQVMQLAQDISNYSLAEADELRKAMGKKNPEILKINRETFINRAIIPKDIASKIYDLIEKFGNYGFNKAHAISYAIITYQTLYFKAKYPKEFYSSVLTTELKVEKKLINAFLEMLKKKIYLLEPSVNKSGFEYEVEGNNIRMPLSALKEMSEKTAKDILNERNKNGEFKDIFDFVLRCKFLNKSNLEGLIYSGALDEFGYNRKTLINNLGDLSKWVDKKIKMEKDIHSVLFLNNEVNVEEYKFKKFDEYSFKELVDIEKEYMKISLRTQKILNENIYSRIFNNDDKVFVGYIEKVTNRVTRNNDLMANIIINNHNGSEEYMIFPKDYIKYSNIVNEGSIHIFVFGTLDDNKKFISQVHETDNLKNFMLSLKIEDENFDKRNELIEIIKKNKGNNSIKIYKKVDGKYLVSKMESKYNIAINDQVLKELIDLLGEENIRISLNK